MSVKSPADEKTSESLPSETASIASLPGEATSEYSVVPAVSILTTSDWQMSEVETGNVCSTPNPRSIVSRCGRSGNRSSISRYCSKKGLSIPPGDSQKSNKLSIGYFAVSDGLAFNSSRSSRAMNSLSSASI